MATIKNGKRQVSTVDYVVTVHLHGTLLANAQGSFSVPCNSLLTAVSACASNNSDATLQLGTSADHDGIMTAAAIGDSGTPTIFDADNFNGALADGVTPPELASGTIVKWLLDYDGAAGTAGQNVEILFVFREEL